MARRLQHCHEADELERLSEFDEVYQLAREHYDGAFRELVDK